MVTAVAAAVDMVVVVVAVDMEVAGAAVDTVAVGAMEEGTAVEAAAGGEIGDMMADPATPEVGVVVVLREAGGPEERPIRSAAYGAVFYSREAVLVI